MSRFLIRSILLNCISLFGHLSTIYCLVFLLHEHENMYTDHRSRNISSLNEK
ncbi:hypothetical protein BU24DRAFT_150201 [Aaosphaeria arxii CBS 175.79]|uniref:Uncharacterized protein n=1 Tax=Aaosphaeria arxii CBS 175.79 TaxID=1450172 RepID=A0A6A5XXP9_9PLEO|nr:uncharacterized protein BU24DRAFT_150201 [Aaosphaeria arxii CBS 175.79]KAF2017420.1 hypothetical protein BU24DRAFT_150201 [Aaosphaeria arxii CBS 175.79]